MTILGDFLSGNEEAPCWVCGRYTKWIEINFQAHLHPGACEAVADKSYWIANLSSDVRFGTLRPNLAMTWLEKFEQQWPGVEPFDWPHSGASDRTEHPEWYPHG